MDWNAAIERNREALKRILASLLVMAELGGRRQFTFFPVSGRFAKGEEQGPVDLAQAANARSHSGGQSALPQAEAPAEKSKLSPALTLPRHLHRTVLRLLRPVEAAARRLVIVIARDLVVDLPRPCKAKPKPKSAFLRNGVGTGIILPRNLQPQPGLRPPTRRTLSLPLLDPLPRWRRRGRPAASGVPRISFPGFGAPFPVPVRRLASPDDPIDAARLALRLQALSRALDDLPREARRFARWKARRDAGLIRRVGPLRPGRPPGQRRPGTRRPAHEVHEVLADLQYFAFKALERPDTS